MAAKRRFSVGDEVNVKNVTCRQSRPSQGLAAAPAKAHNVAISQPRAKRRPFAEESLGGRKRRDLLFQAPACSVRMWATFSL